MRTRRFGWFLALPLVVAPIAAQAQDADPLKAEFSGNFSQTRLSLVVTAIHDATKLNVIVDPRVDADGVTITAAVSRVPVEKFLAEVEKQAKVARTTWCGAVVLHPVGKSPGGEPELPSSPALDARVSMELVDTPFLFALERVRARVQVELDTTARARATVSNNGTSVALKVHRMQVKHLLSHLGHAAGLTWALKDGKATFDAPGATGREVDAREIPLDRDPLATQPTFDVAKLLADLRTPGGREGARRQLTLAGKKVAQPVADALASMDEDAAKAALQILQRIGGPEQAPQVQALFKDKNQSVEVRTEAAATLGAMKAVSAVPALIDALDDSTSFRVAETARSSLVTIGEPAVAPLLARWDSLVGSTGHDGLIYRTLLILGEIKTERCKQVLLKALETTQGPRALALRHHAAIGLGFTRDPGVVEPLIKALEKERQFLVASYIARSLTWITDQSFPPQPDPWRAWWGQNKDKLLAPKGDDGLFDPIELPKDENGLPLLDPNAGGNR
jgi:HEAT repeat protein